MPEPVLDYALPGRAAAYLSQYSSMLFTGELRHTWASTRPCSSRESCGILEPVLDHTLHGRAAAYLSQYSTMLFTGERGCAMLSTGCLHCAHAVYVHSCVVCYMYITVMSAICTPLSRLLSAYVWNIMEGLLRIIIMSKYLHSSSHTTMTIKT